ncbi:MAG: hypothetical protein ACYCTF_10280 [Acidiferrobacter sp.]
MTAHLSAVLRPLAPHARVVTLRPYRALSATIVPDLGLRLVFPSGAQGVRFAITNPVFSAARLGRRAILITVARGLTRRYCGNAYMDWNGFFVSLLVCTSARGRRYTSDILFRRPKASTPPVTPRPTPPSAWAIAMAYAAFGPVPQVAIRKRVVLKQGTRVAVLRVRRMWLLPGRAILGFALSRSGGRPEALDSAVLYRGRSQWRQVPTTLTCVTSAAAGGVACALALARPKGPVRRWHLVVMTGLGPARLSW